MEPLNWSDRCQTDDMDPDWLTGAKLSAGLSARLANSFDVSDDVESYIILSLCFVMSICFWE